ncbi:hypothetical protein [Celeribacter sp. ULVN23_4]
MIVGLLIFSFVTATLMTTASLTLGLSFWLSAFTFAVSGTLAFLTLAAISYRIQMMKRAKERKTSHKDKPSHA